MPAAPPIAMFTVDRSATPKVVSTWGYQLQKLQVTKETGQGRDLIVMDCTKEFVDATAKTKRATEIRYTREDLDTIRSANPNAVLLSYISIGEASDYRCHWRAGWTNAKPGQDKAASKPLKADAPLWLGPANPEWPQSRKVRYWHPDWQSQLFNSARSGWLDAIIDAGFDGCYLDIVDAYWYWAIVVGSGKISRDDAPRAGDPQVLHPGDSDDAVHARIRTAAGRMIDLIGSLAKHAHEVRGKPNFLVVPQNGAEIVTAFDANESADQKLLAQYFTSIAAIAVESTYFAPPRGEGGKAKDSKNGFDGKPWSGKELANAEKRISLLKSIYILANAKPVFAVDYISSEDGLNAPEYQQKIQSFYSSAIADGFLPYAAPHRDLDVMGVAWNAARRPVGSLPGLVARLPGTTTIAGSAAANGTPAPQAGGEPDFSAIAAFRTNGPMAALSATRGKWLWRNPKKRRSATSSTATRGAKR